jgi:hypothetical protein
MGTTAPTRTKIDQILDDLDADDADTLRDAIDELPAQRVADALALLGYTVHQSSVKRWRAQR